MLGVETATSSRQLLQAKCKRSLQAAAFVSVEMKTQTVRSALRAQAPTPLPPMLVPHDPQLSLFEVTRPSSKPALDSALRVATPEPVASDARQLWAPPAEAQGQQVAARHDLVSDAALLRDAPAQRTLYVKRPRSVAYVTPWSDDRVLVASILAGNEADFTLLYTAYSPRIYRFAFKRLRDATEAEDVTQEVFLATHRSLAAYHGNSSLIIWMLGIAHNVVNRRFRRAKFLLTSLDDSEAARVAQDCSPAERVIDARKITRRCATAIARDLTPLQRRIFRLRYLHQHSTRAIAAALGKSEDAVKANLYRIRKVVSAGTDGLEAVLSST